MTQKNNADTSIAYPSPDLFLQTMGKEIEINIQLLIEFIEYPALLTQPDSEDALLNLTQDPWIYSGVSLSHEIDLTDVKVDEFYDGYDRFTLPFNQKAIDDGALFPSALYHTRITVGDITENSYLIKDAVWSQIWYCLLYYLLSSLRPENDYTNIHRHWLPATLAEPDPQLDSFKDIVSDVFKDNMKTISNALGEQVNQGNDSFNNLSITQKLEEMIK